VRFWPLSTPSQPKQFLALAGDRPLLVQTVERLGGLIAAEQILVVTGKSVQRATQSLLPDLPAANILAEPHPMGTGPALTWATAVARARDPNASVLSVHADWFVGDEPLFRRTADIALSVAEQHDVLVTVGIVPTRPETGYGYVEPGEPLGETARKVARFLEKPDAKQASELMARGALWNAAVFAWTAERFFKETNEHAPEIAAHLSHLFAGDVERFFADVTPIVIDVSHYERSHRVAVVTGTFPWDDVGTWTALARVHPHDQAGNVLVGRSRQFESEDCIAWGGDGPVVLFGVRDLVVAQANGVTLVMTKEHAGRLKELVAKLPHELADGNA